MESREGHIDEQLIKRICSGDERAFTTLYYRYHQEVGLHIFRILQDRVQTEELVQEIFASLWLNRASLESVRNMRSYLFVTSKNRCFNVLKKNIRAESKRLLWLSEQEPEKHAHLDPEVNGYYQLLDQAIDNLPPQQQRVYILSRHYRKKYVDIAEELQISRETVKKYLQLANSSISAYLEKHKDYTFLFLLFSCLS